MDNIDWDKFLQRKGLSKSDAARKLGAAPAMVTDWMKKNVSPTYKYLQKLGEIGMTAQEMFGERIGDMLVSNSMTPTSVPPEFNTPEFRDTVRAIFEEIQAEKNR